MAKIVDKVQKRKDIALASKDLFVKSSINSLTISEVAKNAGVAKGSIYDYFKNKEDIVFEIVNILMQEHNERKKQKIAKVDTTKEKLKVFFSFFYDEEDADLRKIYKEFISISLMNQNDYMLEFNCTCHERYFQWFKEILQEGIDSSQIDKDALDLAEGLFVIGDGLFISKSITVGADDIQTSIDNYLDTLFKFIEVTK